MKLSPKATEHERHTEPRPAAVPAVVALLACFVLITALLSGCGKRVSYNVRNIYTDPLFSARSLSNAEIAVLPLLTPRGTFAEGPLAADRMLKQLRPLRPDLRFVPQEAFESAFPPRFDRRQIADFYGKLFRQEILSVKNMDSLWAHVSQPFLLACALRDGAEINNADGRVFKHITVVCELWSRDEREVVWRSACKGVSDDERITDGELLAESIRFLAKAIPITAPNYGRESW